MPARGYTRHIKRVMDALMSNGSETTSKAISSIADPAISENAIEDVVSTAKVLQSMGYIEVVGEGSAATFKTTAEGTAFLNALKGGA